MASPASFPVSSHVSSPVSNLILPPNYKTRFAKTGASASAGAGAENVGAGAGADTGDNFEIRMIKNAISKYRPHMNLTKNELIKLLKKLKNTDRPINLSDPKEVFRFIKQISTINNLKRHMGTAKKNKRMNAGRPNSNAKISNKSKLAILYNSFNSFNSNNLYK